MIVAQRITPLGFVVYKGLIMSQMKQFLDEVDYLVNDARLPVSEVAMELGVSEQMVVDAICIIRDAFMETIH